MRGSDFTYIIMGCTYGSHAVTVYSMKHQWEAILQYMYPRTDNLGTLLWKFLPLQRPQAPYNCYGRTGPASVRQKSKLVFVNLNT